MIGTRVKKSVETVKDLMGKAAGEAIIKCEDLSELAEMQMAYRELTEALDILTDAAIMCDEMKQNQDKILDNQREIIHMLDSQGRMNQDNYKKLHDLIVANAKS